MKIKWNLVGRAGIAWAIIGVVLMILVGILGSVLPSSGVEGLTLWGYAGMFAGVHFTIRSGKGWLEAMIGGAVAGLIAGGIIILVAMLLGGFLPLSAPAFNILQLVGALIAGFAGGLGTMLSKKF